MSSSYSDSDDDYTSSEVTEETESSEKNVKKAPPPSKKAPPKQSSDYDYSDENSSDDSDQDFDYSKTSSSQKKPQKKNSQISQKTNSPKQIAKKNSSPAKINTSTRSNSDYSDYSYDENSGKRKSSSPSKKTTPPAKKSSTENKKEPQRSAKVQTRENSNYSNFSESYSEKPKAVQKNVKQEPAPKANPKQSPLNSTDLDEPPNFEVPPEVLEEARRQKVDRYGWIQTEEPSPREQKILDEELAKEKERSKKWQAMMKKKKWPFFMTRRGFRVVKERTIKGIPNSVRAKAWALLLDPPDQQKPNRGSVQEFFNKGTPSVEHTIRVDIPRTMPNVPEFLKTETRQSLYRILRAYSNASGGGGYFQGMGFHAAIYLLYIKDEEKSFWCLYNLLQGKDHLVKDLFENEFAGLKVLNQVWEVLLEKKFKNVYAHLKNLQVDPMIYTPSWFLCAFLDLDFPPVLRLRIIDRFIVFGSRQLLSLALAIIDLNQEVLSSKSSQMDIVLPLLQNPTTASTMKDWREIVKKWDKHYLSKKDYSALFKKAGLHEIP